MAFDINNPFGQSTLVWNPTPSSTVPTPIVSGGQVVGYDTGYSSVPVSSVVGQQIQQQQSFQSPKPKITFSAPQTSSQFFTPTPFKPVSPVISQQSTLKQDFLSGKTTLAQTNQAIQQSTIKQDFLSGNISITQANNLIKQSSISPPSQTVVLNPGDSFSAPLIKQAYQDAREGNSETYNRINDYYRGYKIITNSQGKQSKVFLNTKIDSPFLKEKANKIYQAAYAEAVANNEVPFLMSSRYQGSGSAVDIIKGSNLAVQDIDKAFYNETIKNSGKTIADYYKDNNIEYPKYTTRDSTGNIIPNKIQGKLTANVPGDLVLYEGNKIPAFHAAILAISTGVTPLDSQLDNLRGQIEEIDKRSLLGTSYAPNVRDDLVKKYEDIRAVRNANVDEIKAKYLPVEESENKFPRLTALLATPVIQKLPTDTKTIYTPPAPSIFIPQPGKIMQGPKQLEDLQTDLRMAKTTEEKTAAQQKIDSFIALERTNEILNSKNRYNALNMIGEDVFNRSIAAGEKPLIDFTSIYGKGDIRGEGLNIIEKAYQTGSTAFNQSLAGYGGLGFSNVYAETFKPDVIDYYPGMRGAYQTGRTVVPLLPYLAAPILGPRTAAGAGGSALGTGLLTAEQVGAGIFGYGLASAGEAKSPEELYGNLIMAGGFSALGGGVKAFGKYGEAAASTAEALGKTSKISPISKIVSVAGEKALPIYFTGMAGVGGYEQIKASAEGDVLGAQEQERALRSTFATMTTVGPFTNYLIESPIESIGQTITSKKYPDAVQNKQFWNKELGSVMDLVNDKSGNFSINKTVGPKKEAWTLSLLDAVGIKQGELPVNFKPVTKAEADQALFASIAGGKDMAKNITLVKPSEGGVSGIRGEVGATDMYFSIPNQYSSKTEWYKDTKTGKYHGFVYTGYASGKSGGYVDQRGILDIFGGTKGPKGKQSLGKDLLDYGGRIVERTTAESTPSMPSFDFFPENRKFIIATKGKTSEITINKVLDEKTGRTRDMTAEEAVKVSQTPKYAGETIKAISEYGFKTKDGRVFKYDEQASTVQAFRAETSTEAKPSGSVIIEIPKERQLIFGKSTGWEFLRKPYDYKALEKDKYKNLIDIDYSKLNKELVLPEYKKPMTTEQNLATKTNSELAYDLQTKDAGNFGLGIKNLSTSVENPFIAAKRGLIKAETFVQNIPNIEKINFKYDNILPNVKSFVSNRVQDFGTIGSLGLKATDYLGYTAKNVTLTFKPVTIEAATWDDIKREYGEEYTLIAKEIARRNDVTNKKLTADEALVKYAALKMKDPNFKPSEVQLEAIKTILQRELNKSLDPISIREKIKAELKGKDPAFTDLQRAKINKIVNTRAEDIGNLSALERKTLREIVSTKLAHPEKYTVNDLTPAERATIDYFLKKDTMNARPDLFPDITPKEKSMAEAWLRRSVSKKLKNLGETTKPTFEDLITMKGGGKFAIKQSVFGENISTNKNREFISTQKDEFGKDFENTLGSYWGVSNEVRVNEKLVNKVNKPSVNIDNILVHENYHRSIEKLQSRYEINDKDLASIVSEMAKNNIKLKVLRTDKDISINEFILKLSKNPSFKTKTNQIEYDRINEEIVVTALDQYRDKLLPSNSILNTIRSKNNISKFDRILTKEANNKIEKLPDITQRTIARDEATTYIDTSKLSEQQKNTYEKLSQENILNEATNYEYKPRNLLENRTRKLNINEMRLTAPEKGTIDYFSRQDAKAAQKSTELQTQYPGQVQSGTTWVRQAARALPERRNPDTGKKEYFLIQDAKTKRYGGIGGGVKSGESPINALRREGFEETSGGVFKTLIRDPTLDIIGSQFNTRRGKAQNQEQVFIAEFAKEPNIVPGKEIKSGKWFTVDELMANTNVENGIKKIILKREGYTGESLTLNPKIKDYLVKPEMTDTFTPNYKIKPQDSIPRFNIELPREYIYKSPSKEMEKDILKQLNLESSKPKEKITSSQKVMLSDIASQLSLPKEFSSISSRPKIDLTSSQKAIFSDIISQISLPSEPSPSEPSPSTSSSSKPSIPSYPSYSYPSYSSSSRSSPSGYSPFLYSPTPPKMAGDSKGRTGKRGMGKAQGKKQLIQVKSSLFRKFAFGEKDFTVDAESFAAFKDTIARKGTFFGYDAVPTEEQRRRAEQKLLQSNAETKGLKAEKSIFDIRV